MSKMGSEFIREAEARSLDNADEVAWLRAEYERLATENGKLEAEKAVLYGACVRAANLFELLEVVLGKHGEALRGVREAMAAAAVFDPAA